MIYELGETGTGNKESLEELAAPVTTPDLTERVRKLQGKDEMVRQIIDAKESG